MDIADYLSRIGLQKTPSADLAALHRLQDHHMRHIPFENLDVVLGRPLILSREALFQKIVTHGRGGYCFELNTLYAALLEEIGFLPVPMLARVWLRDPPETPPRTHLVYRVKIDGVDWISDVGFGGRAARVPVKIEEGYEVDDGDGRIRILRDARFGYRISRYQGGVWSDQYTVETAPAHKADILSGNHWTENHPSSHFKHGIGVGLFTKMGRTSFYDGIFRQRGTDHPDQEISGLEATIDILKSQFGLDLKLTPTERERLKAVLP